MAKQEKRVTEIDVIPGRTLNYSDPRGPQFPQAQLIKGRPGKIRSSMLKMFRELDPQGEILKKPVVTEIQDDGDTETSDSSNVETQDDRGLLENQTQDDNEEKGEEEYQEEEKPKKKTKFLGKKKGK